MDSKYALTDKSASDAHRNNSMENGLFNGFTIKRSPSVTNGNVNDKPKKLKLSNDVKESPSTSAKKNEEQSPKKNFRTIFEQRKRLPAYGCKQRILLEVRRSDTLLLMGETGSGKTTQIPQFLYEAGYANKGIIAITQPRRVAAITVAKRVAEEIGCKLGEQVGFTVRFEDCTSKATKIRFITDGCLVREAISDRLLRNYSVIILDEVHERTINTDILFGIVKDAQKQRRLRNMLPLKVIVTSATMDVDHFGKYFNVPGMYLEGKTYHVKVMHAKEPQSDYLTACLATLFDIHQNAPANHDILVFLTGQEEIEAMAHQTRQIAKTNDLNAPNLRVFPLYSQLPQNKQLECFLPSPPKSRKVIMATNIAETSITIPGIRYVIDCGYVKRRVHDPSTSMDSLKNVRISQAQSWQRCGRAGREAEGCCYRTYTKDEMENFEKMPIPEILRSNFTATAIHLLALGIDCKTFDFLDKPSAEIIDNAYKQLYLLGAIKSTKNPELTPLGKKMALFPLEPRFSKLILSAPNFGCLDEILSVVSILSGENIFVSNTEKREKAALAHAKFHSKYGDHLTKLNVFKEFEKTERCKLWCHDNFLNVRNLTYAREVRNQLKEICQRCDLEITSCGNDHIAVRKCLLTGLYNNVAELQRDKSYLTITSRQKAKIHPSSVLSGKPLPDLVVFTEIISTERSFLSDVSEIEAEWLTDIVENHSSHIRFQNGISL